MPSHPDSPHTRRVLGPIRRAAAILTGVIAPAFAPAIADAQPASPAQPAASKVQSGLKTRWAADMNPGAPLPEYPRPQFERQRWLNLNGRWQWAAAKENEPAPVGKALPGAIVVPFPIESALSGVAEHHDRLWYRRTFDIPADWKGSDVFLNFGAVDWESVVYVNGAKVGEHRGGYDAFSFNITSAIKPGVPQEIIVGVYDPTEAGQQPRGKQVTRPEGIWYTPCTGIWQTVWLEPRPAGEALESIEIVPDLASGVFKMRLNQPQSPGGPGGQDSLTVRLFAGGTQVQDHKARPNSWFIVKPGKPHPWTPEDPFLYDIIIEHQRGGEVIDAIKSYAGLRSVSLGKDAKGRTAIMLNGEPSFQVGPLDQGFWPDGIYTAPTDEALRYDIEITKSLGFNMTRKHVKVEPQRWYYWADRLGLLVWQDMPSSEPYIGPQDKDAARSKESIAQYERELTAMIKTHANHPSIVMWVPFNEGWGQFETPRIVEFVRELDPTRLVNNASGWADRGVGDAIDWHRYPAPGSPDPEPTRAAVLGEFGGLGLPVDGHMWKKDHWGYQGMRSPAELTRTYEKFLQQVYQLHESKGLSAVVYTQLTDVEVEANGLLTYDRAVIKPDLPRIAAANRGDFSMVPPPPVETVIVPTSQKSPQPWRYTLDGPADAWTSPDFDATAWKEGSGGFGTVGTPGAVVGTVWNTRHIWMRREFTLPAAPPATTQLRVHHDEDCKVYLNGVLALSLDGYTGEYEDHPIPPEAFKTLKPGRNTLAVTCSQTRGGQFIDAGLVSIVEQPAAAPVSPAKALPAELAPLLTQPATPATPPSTGANTLVPNGSFENSAADATKPRDWRTTTWNGAGEFTFPAADGRGRSRAVSIQSAQGGDLSWSCNVPVEMQSHYRLSGWIKTKGITPKSGGKGALFNIHGMNAAQTSPVTGDTDWTQVSVEFDTGYNDSVMVNCLFGGWGLAVGQAWYDDVQLTLLSRGTLPAPSISIDASKPRAPVSPYIYGQFIEHLGRCIYGGIWAEMIEDRKFFDAVDAPHGHWKTAGAAKVSMSIDAPFVGEHSPRITLPGDGTPAGIRQDGLAVTQGRSYAGRIWLAGEASAAPVSIELSSPDWAGAALTVSITGITPAFTSHALSFTPSAGLPASDNVTIKIVSSGKGSFRVGTLSLMPSDNVEGFRADTLALLRELDSPVYRWPGGNFVSGYDWRDGVGDPDRRPPRKNPAWTGIEHNDVGIHEFLNLCRLLNTEPYIAVNTGMGTVENAVAEVQYVNGAASTPMGQRRLANGREKPWAVKFWGIGNEMYGDWQLGHVPLADYLKRHASYVDALRAVDHSIKVIGVGAVGEWSKAMLRDNASTLDYLSEHVYWQGRDGLVAHVKQAPDSLARIAQAHREYRRELPSLQGRDIRIVQDEWNYWYGPDIFGELGTRYFMKDALGVAAALHQFVRDSDIFFMANYAQTVNVIGAIKTTRTTAALETTGLVLKLYRHHMGSVPVEINAGPIVDAVAAWTPDHATLTIALVNPTTHPATIPLTVSGATLSAGGRRFEIASPDPMAYNDPATGPKVRIEESSVTGEPTSLTVKPCSVTLLEIPAKPAK